MNYYYYYLYFTKVFFIVQCMSAVRVCSRLCPRTSDVLVNRLFYYLGYIIEHNTNNSLSRASSVVHIAMLNTNTLLYII